MPGPRGASRPLPSWWDRPVGKITGFLEIQRKKAPARPVGERLRDWKEVYLPYPTEELQKQADAAQAKVETAATCAQSFLSAFGMVFDGTTLKQGIEATVQELQGLEPQCAPALSQDGSTP